MKAQGTRASWIWWCHPVKKEDFLDCTSLEAELWDIFYGLKIILRYDMKGDQMVSDSHVAVSLIKKRTSSEFPSQDGVEECMNTLASSGSRMDHTLREGNCVADCLAKKGTDQDPSHVALVIPPDEILEMLASCYWCFLGGISKGIPPAVNFLFFLCTVFIFPFLFGTKFQT